MPAHASSSTPTHHSLAEKVTSLPNELKNIVFKGLSPFIDPSPNCSRIFPPQAWLDLLHSVDVLPWLYDIDLSQCREKNKETHNGQHVIWDWELLIRQLSQPEAFEPDRGFAAGAPLGVRNRRRIWRCLGDLDFEGGARAMEGGWKKYSEPGSVGRRL